MKRSIALATGLLLAVPVPGAARAGDWSWSAGLHDTFVSDMSSHTLGLDGTAYYDHVTASGIHMFGDAQLFVDHDRDHLDPDHIPIWWKLNFEIANSITRGTGDFDVEWLLEVRTRMNTVSNIERQVKAAPGIRMKYDSGRFSTSVKGLAGWFFQEIDDDVAKERGYTRNDFRNKTGAVSLMADAAFAVGKSSRLYVSAQQWHDGDTWLEDQFTASFRQDADRIWANSDIAFEVIYSKYNLDLYTASEPTDPYLPILPWDDDLFVKLTFNASRW